MGDKAVFNIRDYGAKGDGEHKDTKALQEAIDACSQAGGMVYLSQGDYLIGTVYLKSNVTIHLAGGANILGSQDILDYAGPFPGMYEEPQFSKCLLYAEEEKNIAIEGLGCINGQGAEQLIRGCQERGLAKERPNLIRFFQCENVVMRDVTIRESASWCVVFSSCRRVNIDGIRMENRTFHNQDGIDLVGSSEVTIANCSLNTADDSICLKTYPGRPCTNIVISNCIISSNCCAIKFGTGSAADFRNITISNCAIYNCRLGAIKLLAVDGGSIENVLISNITMQNVDGPIFVRLGRRNRSYASVMRQIYDDPAADEGQGGCGRLRRVRFSNMRAEVNSSERSQWGLMVTGVPGYPVEELEFRDIQLLLPGGGTDAERKRQVPEDEAKYPEQKFFGVNPCYGVFLRHARDVVFQGLKVSLQKPDSRHGVYCQDIQDCVFDDVYFTDACGKQGLVNINEAQDVVLSRWRFRQPIGVLLHLGEDTDGVVVRDSDLRQVDQVEPGPGRVIKCNNLQ